MRINTDQLSPAEKRWLVAGIECGWLHAGHRTLKAYYRIRDEVKDMDNNEIEMLTLCAKVPATDGIFGPTKEYTAPIISALWPEEDCYVIREGRFGKYKVVSTYLRGIVFTGHNGHWGYLVGNGDIIDVDSYGETIFRHGQLTEAKEACLNMNRLRKVRVH